MARKKAFGIGKALKAGLSETLVDDEKDSTTFQDVIETGMIDPDPLNPRRLDITKEDLSWMVTQLKSFPDTVSAPGREEVLARIVELAASIRDTGLHQPIRVFREGMRYRIIFGERRYWACRVLNLSHVTCAVSSQRPQHVRVMQYVENLQKEDVDFAGLIRSAAAVFEELAGESGTVDEVSAADFSSVTGKHIRTARRYRSIVLAPDIVSKAIDQGQIRGFREAQEYVSIAESNIELGQRIYDLMQAGLTFRDAKMRATGDDGGSRRKGYYLGRVKDPVKARFVFSRVFPEFDLSRVNWEDPAEVAKAWSDLIDTLDIHE